MTWQEAGVWCGEHNSMTHNSLTACDAGLLALQHSAPVSLCWPDGQVVITSRHRRTCIHDTVVQKLERLSTSVQYAVAMWTAERMA